MFLRCLSDVYHGWHADSCSGLCVISVNHHRFDEIEARSIAVL